MFTVGLLKIALDGHNNQGLEFKHNDTEPMPNLGAGGMSPSGIESYQPAGSSTSTNKRKQQKAMSPMMTAVFLSKTAVIRAAEVDEGTAQLKWESSHDQEPQSTIEKIREARERAKRYKKASNK